MWNTVDEIRTYLNLSDTSHDGILSRLEVMSRALINGYLRRPVEETVFVDRVSGNSRKRRFILQHAPLTAVCAITISNSIVGSNEYEVDLERGIIIFDSAPIGGYRNIEVCYKCGWSEVPEEVRVAQLQTIAWMFNLRAYLGMKSVKLGDVTMNLAKEELPDEVKRMLEPFREIGLA